MVILTLNCGSSSAKYQVYDWVNKDILAVGVVERIGLEYSTIEHKANGKEEYHAEFSSPTHKEAIELIIRMLLDDEYGVISDLKEIGAVGHRVLHGGEVFKQSALVTDEVIEQLKKVIHLGPLHMPANIMGIEAARKAMPSVPQAIILDTAWHQTMPEEAFMYAVPYEWYTDYNVRRYGFHGTSHTFTAQSERRSCWERKMKIQMSSSAISVTEHPSVLLRMAYVLTLPWGLPHLRALSWVHEAETSTLQSFLT